jgi:hypothetical protein
MTAGIPRQADTAGRAGGPGRCQERCLPRCRARHRHRDSPWAPNRAGSHANGRAMARPRPTSGPERTPTTIRPSPTTGGGAVTGLRRLVPAENESIDWAAAMGRGRRDDSHPCRGAGPPTDLLGSPARLRVGDAPRNEHRPSRDRGQCRASTSGTSGPARTVRAAVGAAARLDLHQRSTSNQELMAGSRLQRRGDKQPAGRHG